MNGILAGIMGEEGATELDLVDLTDDEVIEVIDGLGRYRGHRNYKRGMKRFANGIAKRNGKTSLRVRKSDSKMMTGKSLFEKRVGEIENKQIRDGLRNGNLSIADYEVYSIKHANSDTVDMFEPADDRAEGVTNINKGQLGNLQAMLVTGITFQEGVCAAPTGNDKVDGATVDFGKISGATANGDFNFKNGQKIFAERSSMDLFKVKENKGLRNGELVLESPKMLQETKEIVFEVKLPSVPAVANTYFKVMLKGIIVVKA